MLELRHIKLTSCPDCGSAVDGASMSSKHCNGDWNEHMTFVCGAKRHYSPNFRRVLIQERCPKTMTRTTIDVTMRLTISHPKELPSEEVVVGSGREMDHQLGYCLKLPEQSHIVDAEIVEKKSKKAKAPSKVIEDDSGPGWA